MREAKRHKAEGLVQSVCSDSGLLRLILSYVGAGEYFFIARVSALFKQTYTLLYQHDSYEFTASVDYALVDDDDEFVLASQLVFRRTIVTASAARTYFSAAFLSLSRLREAWRAGGLSGHEHQHRSIAKSLGRFGSKEVLKWAIRHGLQRSECVCEGAAREGRFEYLRYLREVLHLDWDRPLVELAACKRGDLPMMQWVHVRDQPLSDSCKAAAASGNIDLLAWLHVHHYLPDDYTYAVCVGAAEAGQLNSMKYLFGRGLAWDSANYMTLAAKRGHVDVVQFLHSKGCSFYDEGIDSGLHAARGGSVAVLALTQASNPVQFAAGDSLRNMLYCCMRLHHLAAAQWLREQRAPWPDKLWFQDDYDDLDTHAIQTCGLEMLQWAVAAGCPYGTDWPFGTCNELRVCGYTAEVDWMHANGCPCGDDCPARL
jgi:hypothetical protein